MHLILVEGALDLAFPLERSETTTSLFFFANFLSGYRYCQKGLFEKYISPSHCIVQDLLSTLANLNQRIIIIRYTISQVVINGLPHKTYENYGPDIRTSIIIAFISAFTSVFFFIGLVIPVHWLISIVRLVGPIKSTVGFADKFRLHELRYHGTNICIKYLAETSTNALLLTTRAFLNKRQHKNQQYIKQNIHIHVLRFARLRRCSYLKCVQLHLGRGRAIDNLGLLRTIQI